MQVIDYTTVYYMSVDFQIFRGIYIYAELSCSLTPSFCILVTFI